MTPSTTGYTLQLKIRMKKIFTKNDSPLLALMIHLDPETDAYEVLSWGYCDNNQEAIDEAVDMVRQVLTTTELIMDPAAVSIERSGEFHCVDISQVRREAECQLETTGMFQFSVQGVKEEEHPYAVMIVKPYAMTFDKGDEDDR